MTSSRTTKKFINNGTWVCPAGVDTVNVVTSRQPQWAAPGASSLFVGATGNLYGAGANTAGALGIGTSTPVSSMTAVVGSLRFKNVWSGGAASLAEGAYGGLYAWGAATAGMLGSGANTALSTPTLVVGPYMLSYFTKVVGLAWGTNQDAVAALTGTGTLLTWGGNANGQLGQSLAPPSSVSSPVVVTGPAGTPARFTDIAGGLQQTASMLLALGTDGLAYSCGSNVNGQLGTGDVTPRSSLTAVVGGITFSQIFVDLSGVSCMAFTPAGALYGWGQNAFGVGDALPRSSPVLISPPVPFTQVALGFQYAFGIASDGTAYATGGSYGQGNLGTGSGGTTAVWTALPGGLKFARIIPCDASNSHFSMGLTLTGQLYAWGNNVNGQLGVGDTVNRSSPTAVLGGLKFADVFSRGASVYGLGSDGTVYVWGANASGQLGTGDVTPRSSPTVMAPASPWSAFGQPQTFNFRLPVTPGVSYPVVLMGTTTFGSTNLQPFGSDFVTITY